MQSKDAAAANDLIARYRKAFPDDHVFPVQAEAELATRAGAAKNGLAVYERSFEPLWPAELVSSYCDLVVKSREARKFSDALRAKLAADPNDLKDAARLFYLYQQQGQLDSAKAVLAGYRTRKDAHGAQWSFEELYSLGRLLEGVQDFPESARYYYALAADDSAPDSAEKGLAGLARILLTAPEQPLRVGAGNLAMYEDIATMDRGPGYLNGILSLLLNSESPRSELAQENQLAVPYFHRARAAELIAMLDKRFPVAPERPELHAALLEAYVAYGESDAVIHEGTAYMAQFPQDAKRVAIALEVADAYARTNQAEKEFALYKDLLKELAERADGVPLGTAGPAYSKPVGGEPAAATRPSNETDQAAPDSTAKPATAVRSAQYAQVLDRYLSRLVSMQRLPDALSVLRGELDRNPQDPGLYERLAEFLEQNSLDAREEEVYQRAAQQFQERSWYAKLARFYLHQKRNADYRALSRKVTQIFSGTELEEYLQQAPAPDRMLALEVNRYAHQRFPHDLAFVLQLLSAYQRSHQQAEVERLLWEHWAESPNLRDQLFELLSRTGRLDALLATLNLQAPEIEKADWGGLARRNPAAERFWTEANLWQSNFEQSVAAADALAAEYPAYEWLGREASSLHRSLAHPEDTDKAVAVEKRLLAARPADLDTLARIGDIYADRERFSEAGPFWMRMAAVHPGNADGYLQSATVFWDYFDFPNALAQLHKARERVGKPALFGYQCGAVEESRGNVTAAIREYVTSALSDEGSAESGERLLTLSRRPRLRSAIEEGTAGLLQGASPSTAAIQLSARIIAAESRNEDLAVEMKQAAQQTQSFDVLDALTEAARSYTLPEVEELVLRRQIALTEDPVRNLQLRYQLVDLLQKNNPAAAADEVDAIYREHGKVLGVVRATVDYDWEHARKPQAAAVLLESAQTAYPELRDKLQLEAARKLTDLGEYPRAKTLLDALLGRHPLDAAYQVAMAENYARAGDQAGLEAFYRGQLGAVQSAALEHNEKVLRLAELRRGMIAAATQLGNAGEAVDQYIELINGYPEDGALAQEAMLYALAHGMQNKLLGFYRKTVETSARDARWSVVLARLETAAEDYPAAIEAYSQAIRLRPERKDLYTALAELEERMHRLDDAVIDYQQLYRLSYHDPQWMEKAAEARARQGRNADAVKALEAAWLDGRPGKAANCFEVAARLERWGLLEEARKFGEQGVELAGADLLVDAQPQAEPRSMRVSSRACDRPTSHMHGWVSV